MPSTAPLPRRFAEQLTALELTGASAHLLVAVSGGCDSVVLLHLLRFAAGGAPSMTVAHFDHAMRDGSEADADWVAGLCAAWGLPLERERATESLRTEAEARDARYRFLRRTAQRLDATHVVTAHHADDQAETVLFRVLRGTGIDGLAGMRPLSARGVARPLLPFWRKEIEGYARRAGLRWRHDPTNRTLHPVRNRIRHELLPWAERRVSPAARDALVRLAEQTREEEEAWDAVLAELAAPHLDGQQTGTVLARSPFRAYHPALGARLLRYLLRGCGPALGRAGTHVALQFITGAPSGRRFLLPGGWELLAEFDHVRLVRTGEPPPDDTVVIPDARVPGVGELRLGGRWYSVGWTTAPAQERPVDAWGASFALGALVFPLRVRGWSPGDRIRLHAGRRRLKKLFVDRRIPRSERARIPLLVDDDGAVQWVAGVVQAPESRPRPEEDALHLTIVHGTDRRDPGPHRGA